jgi:site-specific DNA recombinase
MPLVGAAYLRCSDPRQDKSIEQQKEEISKRAAADGVVIPPQNWLIDEGISGRSTKRRTSYLQLITCAEAQRDASRAKKRGGPQIDRLYVWAFSRLARNMFDALRALATLDEADIDVVSLTEPDAGDRSFRKLIRPILAWLAERYSEELSRNVVRGMRSQAEKGFWQYGHAPYGYAIDRSSGGQRLVVNDDTRAAFDTVKRIFAEYVDGADGGMRLAERLTREGVQPPGRADMERSYAPGCWRPKHIQNILTSPTYCGHIVHDGNVVARGAHEAAIDDATFDRVQAKRALRDRNRKDGQGNGESRMRMGEHGLLTPWLRCGTCGGSVRVWQGGQKSKPTYLYYCATRQENPAACSGVSIRVEKLDKLVMDVIEQRVLAPQNVHALIADTLMRLQDTSIDETAAERLRLAAVIADLDRRIRATGAQVLSGVLDQEDAVAMNAPLRAQRDTAKLQLAALPAQREMPPTDEIDADAFRAAVLEAWAERPIEERRDALGQLVEKITLSPGGVKITYGYCHHEPAGPPKGSSARYRVGVRSEEVRRPRGRVRQAEHPLSS